MCRVKKTSSPRLGSRGKRAPEAGRLVEGFPGAAVPGFQAAPGGEGPIVLRSRWWGERRRSGQCTGGTDRVSDVVWGRESEGSSEGGHGGG